MQPYAPSKDGTRTLGKVIIALVLVVVVVAVVGIVLLGAFLRSVDDGAVPDTWMISVSSPVVQERRVGDVTYWDATTTVVRSTTAGTDILWSDVRVFVTTSESQTILAATAPLPDNPSIYDDGSDGTVSVEAWYIDTDGDGLLGPDDRLKLTGLARTSEGGEVWVSGEFEWMGTFDLPANFP